MQNKHIGYALLASVVAATITGVFEPSMEPEVANFLYSIAGLGFIVFGLWASYKLIKEDNEQ